MNPNDLPPVNDDQVGLAVIIFFVIILLQQWRQMKQFKSNHGTSFSDKVDRRFNQIDNKLDAQSTKIDLQNQKIDRVDNKVDRVNEALQDHEDKAEEIIKKLKEDGVL